MSHPQTYEQEAVSPAPSDYTGRALGDYQVLRRLGRGAMAEVYLAEQKSLGRLVALKVLKRHLANDASYVRRFHHEARAAAALSHANIVQIYEVGRQGEAHYIAQEYVRGKNLGEVVAHSGPLAAPTAVHVMAQVAAALSKAAGQGVVHRDIKPENIMLAASGEVKVADFGLARIATGDGAAALTQVGVTMGTPLYMSPEQVEGRRLDARSDLYSLGVSCYHMLAGRPPFTADTPLGVAVQHLQNQPPPLLDERPDLPPKLCEIVHRLLAKKPGERYQSALALLKDLRELSLDSTDSPWPVDSGAFADLPASAGVSLAAATQQLQTAMTAANSARLTRSRRLYAGLLAVLLAAFVVGGGAAWITRSPPLLETPPGAGPAVQKMGSPQEQWMLAAMTPPSEAESAWKSVSEYFPPEESEVNQRYARLAQRGLADLYLSQGDLAAAQREYVRLAAVEQSEVEFRAAGEIGLANVAYNRGEPSAVGEHLARASALLADIDSPRVREELLDQLPPELQRQYENRFEQLQ